VKEFFDELQLFISSWRKKVKVGYEGAKNLVSIPLSPGSVSLSVRPGCTFENYSPPKKSEVRK